MSARVNVAMMKIMAMANATISSISVNALLFNMGDRFLPINGRRLVDKEWLTERHEFVPEYFSRIR